MCGRRCACACKIHCKKCAGCACVRVIFGRAMCDFTFAHFLEQNYVKKLLKKDWKIAKKDWKISEKMLIYQMCGCECEVREVQIGGEHNLDVLGACVRPKKTVATHTLSIVESKSNFYMFWKKFLMKQPIPCIVLHQLPERFSKVIEHLEGQNLCLFHKKINKNIPVSIAKIIQHFLKSSNPDYYF